MGVRKGYSIVGKVVDIRGRYLAFRVVAGEVADAEVIGKDQDDVGLPGMHLALGYGCCGQQAAAGKHQFVFHDYCFLFGFV